MYRGKVWGLQKDRGGPVKLGNRPLEGLQGKPRGTEPCLLLLLADKTFCSSPHSCSNPSVKGTAWPFEPRLDGGHCWRRVAVVPHHQTMRMLANPPTIYQRPVCHTILPEAPDPSKSAHLPLPPHIGSSHVSFLAPAFCWRSSFFTIQVPEKSIQKGLVFIIFIY